MDEGLRTSGSAVSGAECINGSSWTRGSTREITNLEDERCANHVRTDSMANPKIIVHMKHHKGARTILMRISKRSEPLETRVTMLRLSSGFE